MAVLCGHVYFLHLPIAGKDKLVVPAYIQTDGRVRFFVINTNRTDFQARHPDIASHVIRLPSCNNTRFLNHDSWLTCHEVIGGWTAPDIEAQNGCYRGSLDNSTIASVRQVIAMSRLYSEIVRTQILNHWP